MDKHEIPEEIREHVHNLFMTEKFRGYYEGTNDNTWEIEGPFIIGLEEFIIKHGELAIEAIKKLSWIVKLRSISQTLDLLARICHPKTYRARKEYLEELTEYKRCGIDKEAKLALAKMKTLMDKSIYNQNREQQLVNLCFDLVLTATNKNNTDQFQSLTQDEIAEWVTNNLKVCGFKVAYCGCGYKLLEDKNDESNSN